MIGLVVLWILFFPVAGVATVGMHLPWWFFLVFWLGFCYGVLALFLLLCAIQEYLPRITAVFQHKGLHKWP